MSSENEIVIHEGPDASPPKWAINDALRIALMSPCQKRKVGIAVYRCVQILGPGRERVERTGLIGFNGPPVAPRYLVPGTVTPALCDGSKACRESCARRCVHAEFRALNNIGIHDRMDKLNADLLRMVHVKLDDYGHLKPNGGPSCIECSKHILDASVGGIWLYQDRLLAREIDPRWIYYDAENFHTATCRRLGVH